MKFDFGESPLQFNVFLTSFKIDNKMQPKIWNEVQYLLKKN